jgi:hypothetical protein
MSVSHAIPVNLLRDSAPGAGRKLAGEIGRSGDDAVVTLLRFLSAEGENHVVRNHAFDALKALGRGGLGPVLDHLKDFDDYENPTRVYIAKGLVRLVGEIDDERVRPALIGLMRKLIALQEKGATGRAWHFMQQIKMEIHAVLAGFGCRDMLDDLMVMLGAGEEMVFPVVIQSIGSIGDRRAILPLIRLHALEGEETWLSTEIRKAFRKVVRREKIDTAALSKTSGLTSKQQSSLQQLLDARRRNGRK